MNKHVERMTGSVLTLLALAVVAWFMFGWVIPVIFSPRM